MPDRTGIFLGWSANLSNFLGLGVEAGASPMYPQKMRVPPWGFEQPRGKTNSVFFVFRPGPIQTDLYSHRKKLEA